MNGRDVNAFAETALCRPVPLTTIRSFSAGLVVAFGLAATLGAQPEPAAAQSSGSPLRIEEIRVTPERPGSEALCQLVVRLHNAGEKPMYAFGVDVQIDGKSLPVYERQLYLQAVPAGSTAELRLFNFWTTETGRARPANGKLELTITVREALWLDITTEAAPADGGKGASRTEPVEVWTPAGEVPGLPVRATRVLELGS